MRTLFGFAASAVVALVATANAGVTSTFVANSEFWSDGGGNASFGWVNEMGPDAQPGVLGITTPNNPSFPNVDGPADFQGDLNRYTGAVVSGKNLLMSFDAKYVNADYPGAEFRIITTSGGPATMWRKFVGNPAVGVNEWDHIDELINTNWTDTEALANGWILHQGANSFAFTFANVATYRIDFQAITPNITQVRFDNISLNELTPIPEPASVGLMVLGGLALARRRRA
jgi:hypothetical protein